MTTRVVPVSISTCEYVYASDTLSLPASSRCFSVQLQSNVGEVDKMLSSYWCTEKLKNPQKRENANLPVVELMANTYAASRVGTDYEADYQNKSGEEAVMKILSLTCFVDVDDTDGHGFRVNGYVRAEQARAQRLVNEL